MMSTISLSLRKIHLCTQCNCFRHLGILTGNCQNMVKLALPGREVVSTRGISKTNRVSYLLIGIKSKISDPCILYQHYRLLILTSALKKIIGIIDFKI